MTTALATLFDEGPAPLLRLLPGSRVETDGAPRLKAGDVARRLGVARKTVWRIPADQLPYELSPGGGQRQQRLYRAEDVDRYRQRTPSLPPSTEERLAALEADVADLKAWRERDSGR